MIEKFILVLIATIAIDYAYVAYTKRIVANKAVPAGVYAAIIYALNSFVVISFVKEPIIILAAIIGTFFGTILAVRLEERREKAEKEKKGDKE